MFTARYAQSPYITQIRFVFKRLRDEKGMGEFAGRVIRRVFEPNSEEVRGGWKKKMQCNK